MLGSIVQPLVRAMFDIGYDLMSCGSIGARFVSDDPLWRAALFLQQPSEQSPRGCGITAALNNLIENVTIVVDCAPRPVLLAAN